MGDGGLVDLCLFDRGVGVFVSHLAVALLCWVAVGDFAVAVLLSSSRWKRETDQDENGDSGLRPPCFVAPAQGSSVPRLAPE